MTTFWSDWELQEDTGLEFEYLDVPSSKIAFPSTPPIGPDGIAEIRAHNRNGIAGGLKQLHERKRRAGTPKVLITYRPLIGTKAAPDGSIGRATAVQVFATKFVPPKKTPLKQGDWYDEARSAVARNTWWDLGSFTPPAQIDLTLENRGLFGAAIEDAVRTRFQFKVLVPSNRLMQMYTGGGRKGPDVVWKELADLYAELGRELRDPLYAELALELSG